MLFSTRKSPAALPQNFSAFQAGVVMKADNVNTALHVPKPAKSLGKLTRAQVPYYAIAEVVPYVGGDHHAAIAEAAYFHAERRGFAPGHELDDWLAGEGEINERLISEGRQF